MNASNTSTAMTLSDARGHIGTQAAWEIRALIESVRDLSEGVPYIGDGLDDDVSLLRLRLRCITDRVSRLASVVIAIFQGAEATKDLAVNVFGKDWAAYALENAGIDPQVVAAIGQSAESESFPFVPSKDFRTGLELFDKMLKDTSAAAANREDLSCWLEAEFRHGQPFRSPIRHLVQRLLEHPEMADGFSAALGNCLASASGGSDIHGTVPTTYSDLTDDQIFGTAQQPVEENHG